MAFACAKKVSWKHCNSIHWQKKLILNAVPCRCLKNRIVWKWNCRFAYVVHTDLDDFIVPRTEKTWSRFLNTSSQLSRAGQFVFANVYFMQTGKVNSFKIALTALFYYVPQVRSWGAFSTWNFLLQKFW